MQLCHVHVLEETYKELFDRIDQNDDRKITWKELRRALGVDDDDDDDVKEQQEKSKGESTKKSETSARKRAKFETLTKHVNWTQLEMMMKGKEYVTRDAFAHAMLRTTLSLTMDDIQYIQDMFRSDDGDSVRILYELFRFLFFYPTYHSSTNKKKTTQVCVRAFLNEVMKKKKKKDDEVMNNISIEEKKDNFDMTLNWLCEEKEKEDDFNSTLSWLCEQDDDEEENTSHMNNTPTETPTEISYETQVKEALRRIRKRGEMKQPPFGHFATETNKRTRHYHINRLREKLRVARYGRKVKDMTYRDIFKQGNEMKRETFEKLIRERAKLSENEAYLLSTILNVDGSGTVKKYSQLKKWMMSLEEEVDDVAVLLLLMMMDRRERIVVVVVVVEVKNHLHGC